MPVASLDHWIAKRQQPCPRDKAALLCDLMNEFQENGTRYILFRERTAMSRQRAYLFDQNKHVLNILIESTVYYTDLWSYYFFDLFFVRRNETWQINPQLTTPPAANWLWQLETDRLSVVGYINTDTPGYIYWHGDQRHEKGSSYDPL